MASLALGFGDPSAFGGPAQSFGVVQPTVLTAPTNLPSQIQTPATSFDPTDASTYIPAIDNLGGLALQFLKQVDGSSNAGQLIAANPNAGGVVTGNGAAVGAAGALSTSSATIAGIPITYLIIGLVLILLLRR